MAQVHGLPHEEICLNPYAMIVPEERQAFQDAALTQIERQEFFQGTLMSAWPTANSGISRSSRCRSGIRTASISDAAG